MKNQKSVLKGKIVKAALKCVAIYIGYGVVDALPSILKAVIVTAIVVGFIIPRAKNAVANAGAAGGKAVSRVVKASKAICAMSDEEFDSRFSAGTPSQAPAAERTNFVPQHLCFVPPPPPPPPARPQKSPPDIAKEWWAVEINGMSGAQRLMEVMSRISCEDSSKRTCILNEYAEELMLPKDPAVLEALVVIMKEYGLEADINDDGYFIILWDQYEDGMEASHAHATAAAGR